MTPLLPLVALAQTLLLPVSDTVPRFDPAAGCRSAALAAGMTEQEEQRCVTQETSARTSLETTWNQYPASLRNRCVETTSIGGAPSYVEIAVCLRIGKAVETPKTTD